MRSILFRFRVDVPLDLQDSILSTIRSWPAVARTGRVHPDTKQPEFARHGFVYLDQGANVDDAVRRLSDVPEIESAFVPAEHRLIK